LRRAAPLEGIKVVDLTRALAGPYCTMMLADLGAEVIKVEAAGKGDESRSWGPPFTNGESAYFMSVNRNKKSVALDLRSPGALEVIRRLVKEADVFVENFRPGTAGRLGVGYGTLKKLNPRLVYCSISGFGQTGPRRDMPGYDIIALALSGMMSITGEEGRPPVKMGVPVSDIGAGMFAAFAIVTSLYRRQKSGTGERIDVSLTEGQLSWLTHQAASYFATGEIPRRMGSAHAQIAPYQAFRASDEYFVVAVGNDAQWMTLSSALSPRLAHDRRFSTNSGRIRYRDALDAELARIFARKKAAHWIRLLSRAGVPTAPINTLDRALSDPQVAARNMILEVEHPKAGRIKQLNLPYRLDGYSFTIRAPPPTLGQDTAEVLAGLGYTPEEIGKLKKAGTAG
jgi:crotonobetainyl-CoA:carnitine CoA-transferase CaiB-like acyl-CoA transferase